MRADPSWSYVQARVQARHGGLLAEHDWRSLAAAKSVAHFLERTRATWLRRFTDPLSAGMASHAIERQLRASWRAYVAQVGEWVPAPWQPAVLWMAVLADLPLIPEDPANIESSALAPLLVTDAGDAGIGERWHAHWRTLWPRDSGCEGMDRLARIVGTHVEMLARAGAQARSAPYRHALAQALVRLFRRHGGTPVAVFAHLGLVALELEQLRGAVVRRRLFADATEAA